VRRALAAAAVVIAGTALALVPASVASAHGAHSPTATNYRTEITTVTPAPDGLHIRTIEAGTGLELTNHTGRTIEVLGYDGEPYLQVRPDGTYENVNSAATYLNVGYTGVAPVPSHVDPDAEPSWRRVEREPVARWYDHRTHWMLTGPPPRVAADPGSPHRVLEWTVPLRDGDTPIEVTGTLEWVPPPSPWPWWAAAVLTAAAVAALGLVAHSRPARAALALAAIGGGAVALTYVVARELDAGAGGAGELLVWLVTGQVWPLLAALAAIAAGGYLLAGVRRADGPSEVAAFGLAVGGACLAIFGGLADAAVFARAIPPVPFSPDLARVAILAVIATGAGVAGAAGLALRRTRTRVGA
jgi:hypothetical protein